MGHPKRREFIESMDKALGEKVPISIDIGFGLWENCKRAWLLYDKDADYHVVLQDDAIICKDFKKKAEQFISKYNKEKRAFNFYFGRRVSMNKNILAEGITNGYIILPKNMWGVAICLPTSEIKSMIEKCDTMTHIPQDDTRIGRYLSGKKFNIIYPMPSLIDHRSDLESLVGNALSNGRRAYKFIDNE
jgi:hypothetical protein